MPRRADGKAVDIIAVAAELEFGEPIPVYDSPIHEPNRFMSFEKAWNCSAADFRGEAEAVEAHRPDDAVRMRAAVAAALG